MKREPRSSVRATTPPPLVTVITPCLNPGYRIKKCIQSISRQQYKPIEHLIVDGGSSDGTVEYLQSLADNIKWVSEPDKGQANAINKGIRLSKGQIVTWLNADDILTRDAVTRVISAFKEESTIQWVYGDCEVTEPSRTWTWKPEPRLSLDSFLLGNAIPQPGTFISRKALDQIGLMNESLNLALDVDLWIRLLMARVESSYVPSTLAVFEIHEDSKSGRHTRADFLLEEAQIYLDHGLPMHRAFAIGRAAAHRVADDSLIAPRGLRATVKDLLRQHWPQASRLNGLAASAAADSEIIRIGLRNPGAHTKVSPLILRPSQWFFRETRRSAIGVIKTLLVKARNSVRSRHRAGKGLL